MKRFYKETGVTQADGGWRVTLDGRPIRTQGGRPQVVPTRALAEALAAEWAAQGEEIVATSFVLRDLADFALDAVAEDRAGTVTGLVPYAETDTLCYRADPEDALYKRQLAIWEPLLAEAEGLYGVKFQRVSGIVHKPQPPATLQRLAAELEGLDAFGLAAARMLASLAASLTVALLSLRPGADAEGLFAAANLEEDWQVELWGQDWEAEDRRAARLSAFRLAIDFAGLARQDG